MSPVAQTTRVNALPKPHVRPSTVSATPFTLDQEFEVFGKWIDDPVWVPPKDASVEMADFMLRNFGMLASKVDCWTAVANEFRGKFTQVRQIEMKKASIRLPQSKLFVSVLEQHQFDQITDEVPRCVQTRLEEFLAGPGKQPGVKVYYLKPLCVEIEHELVFTSEDDVDAAIKQIQDEVFSAYRWMYAYRRPVHLGAQAIDLMLTAPRYLMKKIAEQKQRTIDAYQARLEFNRRKTALRACNVHRRTRTDGCTYDEMLSLTNPLERTDVINQYAAENLLSESERRRLMMIGVGSLPWFFALSIGISYLPALTLTVAPPVVMCDPAFVAEMPGANGALLKIGHFDKVRGVTHVEL